MVRCHPRPLCLCLCLCLCLQAESPAHPILKADAIKFTTIFRNQLPTEAYLPIMGAIAPALTQEGCPAVTAAYTAHCIERLLVVRDRNEAGGWTPRLTKEMMTDVLEPLLGGFFMALAREETKESQYIMKALMRLVAFSQEQARAPRPLPPLWVMRRGARGREAERARPRGARPFVPQRLGAESRVRHG